MLVWRSDYRLVEERARSAEARVREAELAVKILTDVVDRLTQAKAVEPMPERQDDPPVFPKPVAMAIAEQRVAPAEMRRLTRWAREQHRLGRDPADIAKDISLGMAE